ncbi:MAG: putative DedA/PAP2 family phospholipid acid phosphatase [Frankiales bacterium]|jgi:membrane protein DedA with SNARE-associated domain/membrane-associated phospholipid phosphatase|nr:putative DedA/PAP2 family phospholipid acid phosphatase [Frankiales bacterium]
MSKVVDAVLSLSGTPAYGLVGLLAAGEAAAFVGLFLPGEAALLLGGVLASQGRVSLPVMIAVAVVAAIVGDSIGYEVGRRGGPALKRSRLGRVVGADRWAKGEAFLERRGGPAVFLGRWVGLLRALVPSLAGMGRMPYRRFLVWNALGGLLWASTVVLIGYAAGAQYKRVEQLFGRASLLVGLVTVVLGGAFLLARSVARHPAAWRARIGRLGAVPPLPALRLRFDRQLAFLARRLDTAQALGLTLTIGLATVIAAGGAFAVVLEDALNGDGVAGLDRPVLRFLASHRDDEATAIARVVTFLGGVPFVVLVTAAITAYLWSRSRRSALVLAASVLGSGIITGAIKHLVARDRPALPLAIDAAEKAYSFPSGHSLNSMALYGALSYLAVQYLPTWRSRTYVVTGLLATAVAVAFSRLYLGYHWVSDVLASWTLAALWLATVITADRVLAERVARRVSDQVGDAHADHVYVP